MMVPPPPPPPTHTSSYTNTSEIEMLCEWASAVRYLRSQHNGCAQECGATELLGQESEIYMYV